MSTPVTPDLALGMTMGNVTVTTEPTVIDRRPNYDGGDCGKKDTLDTPSVPVAPMVTALPIGNKVLLWRIPEVEGTVVTPEAFKDKPVRCKVVACGRGKGDLIELFSPGDEVLIRSFSGTEVKVDGHDLTVVLVDDILLRL